MRRKAVGGKAEGSVEEGERMNEDCYGASDREQELNDLEDMARRILNTAKAINEEYFELDRKHGFCAEEILQSLGMEITMKIQELREG